MPKRINGQLEPLQPLNGGSYNISSAAASPVREPPSAHWRGHRPIADGIPEPNNANKHHGKLPALQQQTGQQHIAPWGGGSGAADNKPGPGAPADAHTPPRTRVPMLKPLLPSGPQQHNTSKRSKTAEGNRKSAKKVSEGCKHVLIATQCHVLARVPVTHSDPIALKINKNSLATRTCSRNVCGPPLTLG